MNCSRESDANFACGDINRLIPEPGSYVDNDVFICERNPPTGYIILDGYKIPCGGGKAEKVSTAEESTR